jgi:hypothetical protein
MTQTSSYPARSRSLHEGSRGASNWLTLAAATFAVVILTYVTHEAGHALMAKLLGYRIDATLNAVTIAGGGGYRSVGDRLAVDLAGPLVTLGIAIAAFLSARTRRWRSAPSFLFVALMMRLTAAAVSIGNPNDEARVSLALGLGSWSVFAVMIVLLGAMFVITYRRLRLGWRWLLVSYIAASVAFALIVFGARMMSPLTL